MGSSKFGVVKYQIVLPTKIPKQIVLKRVWDNFDLNEDLLIKIIILIEYWKFRTWNVYL